VHSLESFSEAELQRIHLAIADLSAYLLSAERFQADNQPAAGSPFVLGSKENGGIWWRETGDLALAASFDHLLAFTNLLTGNVPRQAGYSVLRGCAEAAAIAWWLFDPTASEEQRVQRGFEERLYGIHTQRGLIEEKNMPTLEARHDELVADAARHGLTEQPDSRKEGLTTFGRPRLSIQDLLARMLSERTSKSELPTGEVLWRSLSAFSHSEIWTSLIGLREVEDDTKPRTMVVNLNVLLGFGTAYGERSRQGFRPAHGAGRPPHVGASARRAAQLVTCGAAARVAECGQVGIESPSR
jgi:hypothetical protein